MAEKIGPQKFYVVTTTRRDDRCKFIGIETEGGLAAGPGWTLADWERYPTFESHMPRESCERLGPFGRYHADHAKTIAVLEADLRAKAAENARLRVGIEEALRYPSKRWREWGERAMGVREILMELRKSANRKDKELEWRHGG